MPDALAETQARTKEAVVYLDDVPHLELTAEELVYPIRTPDESYKVYCHMRRYEPWEIKPWYDVVVPKRRRRSQSESSIETPDTSEQQKFVLDHLIRMEGVQCEDGSEPTLEQTKGWLAENPAFTRRIFTEGVDRVGPRDRVQLDTSAGKPMLVFGRATSAIRTEVTLYSRDRKADEIVPVVHTLTRLSESDRHQYDKAVAVIENARRGEVYYQSNWDVIELLYNHRIKSLSGAVMDGQACNEQNKGDAKSGWARLVPFVMKVYVMAQAFLEIDLKNA